MTIIFRTENQSTYHLYPERMEWERIEALGESDPYQPLRTQSGRYFEYFLELGKGAIINCPPIDEPESHIFGRQIMTTKVVEITYDRSFEAAMAMEMAAAR